MTPSPIEAARRAAGKLLRDRGYDREAAIVLAGEGDDFAEVRIALNLLDTEARDRQRQTQALAAYADADFWDEAGADLSPALTDRGAIARAALATH